MSETAIMRRLASGHDRFVPGRLWTSVRNRSNGTMIGAVDELRRIAARQGGLFTRAQALGCGLSAYQIRRRLTAGEWRVVLGSVLAPRDLTLTARLRDRAVGLAVPGAVLAAGSAARLLGIPVPDTGAYLWIGPLRRAPIAGVRFLRDPLSRREVMRVEGVPITDPPRTVFDCLRFLDEPAAVRLLDRAVQAGWITELELVRRVRAHTGRRGAPRLARLSRLAGSGARSEAERLAVDLLRRSGITGWVANHPIFDRSGLIGVGDLVFIGARLVVEIDGWAFHSTSERFELDRRRQNRLVAAGWTVLRFTWRDLTQRPQHVIGTIQAVLRSNTQATDLASPNQRRVPGPVLHCSPDSACEDFHERSR